ncbi:hypothetical protein [Microvirga sp. G4-2]|uniref:hypothetical protein n=1 Tax=Microvirga sp. G4-2 TaxID=3434467 RepID=UPI0040443C45
MLAASAVTLVVMSSGAEARKVSYEINGKRYSYSTNNRAETEEAKKRIAAAKALEAAKAKADEERSKHPLVAAFGSTTQREAKQAEERLKQLLPEETSITKPSQSSPESSQSSPERRADQRDKRRDSRKDNKKRDSATVLAAQQPALPKALAAVAPPPVAEPVRTPHQAKVRSISFDVETGIRTIIMVDGAVEEEPFDSSVLTHLVPEQGQANSLMAFVNQLRKAAPEETTGSVTTKLAQPAP